MPLTRVQVEDCSSQIKILNKRIRTYVNDILALKDIVLEAEDDPSSHNLFLAKLEAAKETYAQFTQTWEKLEVLHMKVNDDDFPQSSDLTYRSQVMDVLHLAHALRIKLERDDRLKDNAKVTAPEPRLSKSALPRLSLPHFSGNITAWVQFRDTFLSLVHNDPSLAPVEKYHYLISSLSGEALQLVTQYQVSDSNYQVAWQALLDTYNNSRVLASIYLQKILNYQASASNTLPSLQGFLTHVADSILAFRALKLEKAEDTILSFLALRALDPNTRHQYELSQLGVAFPPVDSLITFVKNGCQALRLSSTSNIDRKSSRSPQLASNMVTMSRSKFPNRSSTKYHTALMVNTKSLQANSSGSRPNRQRAHQQSAATVKRPAEEQKPVDSCPFCHQTHALFRCFDFAQLPPSERMAFISKWRGCSNCLRPNHSAKECTSKLNCRYCNGRHHALLHQSPEVAGTPSALSNLATSSSHVACKPSPRSEGESVDYAKKRPQHQAFCASFSCPQESVLLGTAQALIADQKRRLNTVRVLFDSGSTRTFITQRCAARLNLPISAANSGVSGLGGGSMIPVKGKVSCQLYSCHDLSKFVTVEALVIPSITDYLPLKPLPPSILSHFQAFSLADPDFGTPQCVELLLGADILNYVICGPPRFVGRSLPFVTSTLFGDIISGSYEATDCDVVAFFSLSVDDLRNQLAKFWELEEAAPAVYSSPDDLFCEQHFLSTHSRTPSGRYVVRLPLSEGKSLGSNRDIALRRFTLLERKFNRDKLFAETYKSFMQEYLALGHMSLTSSVAKYVIPHHAVQKGKLRVVFDGSCSSTTFSLNEVLLPGPKLQADIGDILLRFRFHRFAIVADLVKMYRQVLVHEEDRKYQHILWRDDPSMEVKEFSLNTVTYGLTPSAFLAMRVLKQLVTDEGGDFPLASSRILDDMYVDDIVTGASSAEEAKLVCTQLVACFSRGGFALGKWASNYPEVLPSNIEANQDRRAIEPDELPSLKVLGLTWSPQADVFSYVLVVPPVVASKRIILSAVARIFDPLGFLSPVVLVAKLLLQRLWQLNVAWDDQLPSEVQSQWEQIVQQWPYLHQVEIPRSLCSPCDHKVQCQDLYGFCDASQRGYASVIYLRTEMTDGDVRVRLLKSKTKVAPLKYNSIARLELCAAVLLAKLYSSITFPTSVKIRRTHFLSDSAVVLAWLRTPIYQLKTFEAHRVSMILEFTRVIDWFHVKSGQNPADPASRGLMPRDIVDDTSWWHGPLWIREPVTLCPGADRTPDVSVFSSGTHGQVLALHSKFSPAEKSTEPYWLAGFRNLQLLNKTIARLFRFFGVGSSASATRPDFLSVAELRCAKYACIKMVQRLAFPKGVNSSNVLDLCPFMDNAGLLRVGGRLQHAPLPEQSRFPVLLPSRSHFTKLVIMDCHTRHYHAGPNLTLALLRTEYWILSACRTIKSLIRRCTTCRRRRPTPCQPIMAPLPSSRFSQGRPFIQVGTDFAGPFLLRESLRRKSAVSKIYLCLFVCLATKALHLEAVTSLSSEAFLATLDRFIARRGMPSAIHSDNGTNFVGANRYLKEIFKWLREQQATLSQTLAQQGIEWHFSPPRAPHFGGLWEAGVKSVKRLLPTAVGSFPHTYEELSTIFARIEALLNSRPLCALRDDPDQLEALTPGHFIIGTSLKSIPEEDLTAVSINRLTRWQLVQHRVQHVWSRWNREYLHTMQQRSKWTKPSQSPVVGEVVVLLEKHTSPGQWPLARVISTHPGADGIVRVVTLRLPSGAELRRAVSSIALLPRPDS